MYNKEKIYQMLEEIVTEAKDIEPYVVVAQPRRNLKELPVQNFDDFTVKHVDFSGFSRGFVDIGGEMVDVARNWLIDAVLETGAKYLFFIGEDTVIPYDGYMKLHEVAEKNPDAMVVGVYYIKNSIQMITKREGNHIVPANVDPGQIFEAWMSGLDAALIPVQLLRNMKESDPEIPFCCIANKVLDYPFIGEDNFFVYRWRKMGYKVLVNTDVQCLHMDLKSGKYEAHPSVDLRNYFTQIPITEPFRGALDIRESQDRWHNRLPNNSGTQLERIKEITKDNEIKLNLGSGMFSIDGYVNIDKYYHHSDIQMDVEDLNLPENTVNEILGIHLFEHLNPFKVDTILSNFYKMLKPGGKIIMELPDVEKICEKFVTANKNERDFLILELYGASDTFNEKHTGNITSPHLWGWYPDSLKEKFEKSGFKNIEITKPMSKHPGENFRIEGTK